MPISIKTVGRLTAIPQAFSNINTSFTSFTSLSISNKFDLTMSTFVALTDSKTQTLITKNQLHKLYINCFHTQHPSVEGRIQQRFSFAPPILSLFKEAFRMGKANTLNGFHLLTFLRATMINFMQSLSLSAISVFVRFCKSLPPELFLHLSSWNESLVFAMLYTLLRVKQYKLLIKYSNAEIKRITLPLAVIKQR